MQQQSGTGNLSLEGPLWMLESVTKSNGRMVDAIADVEATVEFRGGRLAGNASCNRFTGGYVAEGDSLSVGRLATTMMACPDEERMTQERRYTRALQAAARYLIEGDRLTIRDGDGQTLMTFRGVAPAGLPGTHWTATMVNDGRQGVTSLVEGTAITLSFGEDGRISGSAGCNRYMASYTLDGESITISPPGTTRRYCDGKGVMDQEAAYVKMLEQAATYHLSGSKLEIRTADGALIAGYVAAAAEDAG